MKSFVLIFTALIFLSISANADIAQQAARNDHMRTCLGQGGQKDICLCSFEKAQGTFTLEELTDLNRRLSSGLPTNPDSVEQLGKLTARCVKEKRQQKNPNQASAPRSLDAPAIPALPSFAAPQLPAISQIAPPKVEDLDKKPTSVRRAPRIRADKTNVPQEEYLFYANQKQKTLKSAHFSEYDELFFHSVATGDLEGMIAGSNDITNFNLKNELGETPLMTAAKYNQIISAEFLLERKVPVNERTPIGQTALHFAANSGGPEMINLLLDSGADLNASYGPGYQPIHLSVLSGNIQAAEALLRRGAGINTKMGDGNQPIHLSVARGDPQVIKYLISRNADIGAQNNTGQTALHIAVQSRNITAIETLLSLGANYLALDALGSSPISLAQQSGDRNIIDTFQTYQERQRLQQYGLSN